MVIRVHFCGQDHVGLIRIADFQSKTHFALVIKLCLGDRPPPHLGAGVTLGIELRSTAEVYPQAGSPKLRGSLTFPVPRMPAKSRQCQKHHNLAEVARTRQPLAVEIVACSAPTTPEQSPPTPFEAAGRINYGESLAGNKVQEEGLEAAE
ncbi:unnamed protein product [Strongylus vulgaris]|uniref:Uncharacterized protein n=1 Tax=Strongylus vulgaris TaxID=40348 RepID=A0A3P7L2K3_STRVU|nr:unnamed protein product [Strongylus vulgaris]